MTGLPYTLAALLLPILCAGLWRFYNRRRRRERAPVKTRLLRPAGYSLEKRVDDLIDQAQNRFFSLFVVAVFLTPLLPLDWMIAVWISAENVSLVEVWNTDHGAMIYTCLAGAAILLLLGFWLTHQLLNLITEARNCRFGARGEQAVGEILGSLPVVKAGYQSYHDLPSDYGNIDHVSVGPGGIFVVETKTRSKRKATRDQAEHEVHYDGKTLRFPWCDDNEAVKQVLANAQWLRQRLAKYSPAEFPIKPVIVVPGWYTKSSGKFPVVVCNHEYLGESYIAKEKPVMTAEQVQLVAKVLDDLCRTVEF